MDQDTLVPRSYQNLRAYRRSASLASEIFWISRRFPSEQPQTLILQLRRAAHTIPETIAKAWMKRHDFDALCTILSRALAASGELSHWLNVARACGYLTMEEHALLLQRQVDVQRSIRRLQHQPHAIVV